MAKMLERSAEAEIWFKTNWTATPIFIEDATPALDTSNLETYIKIEYANLDNELSGMDRQQGFGTYRVSCYHKIKKLALKLSDDVNEFFSCKELPKDIHTKEGIQGEIYKLDNDMYLTTITFDINQYS